MTLRFPARVGRSRFGLPRPLPLVLGLCLLAFGTVANAQTRAADIKALLEGYEWRLEPERFTCIGDGIDVALRQIASEATLPNYYRLRAVTALSLFPNPETAGFLERMISDSASHPSHVQRALHAYAYAYADQQPQRVTEVARNALNLSTDYQIQTAAAQTLAGLRTTESKQALRGYLNSGLSDLQRRQVKHMVRESKALTSAPRGPGSGATRIPKNDCA